MADVKRPAWRIGPSLKQYTIEFVYVDNQQVYRDNVALTNKEYERVKAFLDKVKQAGFIASAGVTMIPTCL